MFVSIATAVINLMFVLCLATVRKIRIVGVYFYATEHKHSNVSSNYTGTFASQELPVENPLYFSFVIGLSPTSINGNNLFTIS